jgi:hypothetical protein
MMAASAKMALICRQPAKMAGVMKAGWLIASAGNGEAAMKMARVGGGVAKARLASA